MFSDERKTLEHINKKWVKVLTVITYVISVSLVALILGLYYKLAWNPKYNNENYNYVRKQQHESSEEIQEPLSLGTIKIRNLNEFDNKFSLDEFKSKLMDFIIDDLKERNFSIESVNEDKMKKHESIELKSSSTHKILFSLILKTKDN
ncbi:unnamed protein product [Brachionus calyciflorus]|uniref:Uncharacterized protein n=1 Tax=Brachionus calyciflorus TaxID=104777 RepID=A0A814APZ4_9BILA|nr:unnamed protein product [Brachionus calyciflorus]